MLKRYFKQLYASQCFSSETVVCLDFYLLVLFSVRCQHSDHTCGEQEGTVGGYCPWCGSHWGELVNSYYYGCLHIRKSFKSHVVVCNDALNFFTWINAEDQKYELFNPEQQPFKTHGLLFLKAFVVVWFRTVSGVIEWVDWHCACDLYVLL